MGTDLHDEHHQCPRAICQTPTAGKTGSVHGLLRFKSIGGESNIYVHHTVTGVSAISYTRVHGVCSMVFFQVCWLSTHWLQVLLLPNSARTAVFAQLCAPEVKPSAESEVIRVYSLGMASTTNWPCVVICSVVMFYTIPCYHIPMTSRRHQPAVGRTRGAHVVHQDLKPTSWCAKVGSAGTGRSSL